MVKEMDGGCAGRGAPGRMGQTSSRVITTSVSASSTAFFLFFHVTPRINPVSEVLKDLMNLLCGYDLYICNFSFVSLLTWHLRVTSFSFVSGKSAA